MIDWKIEENWAEAIMRGSVPPEPARKLTPDEVTIWKEVLELCKGVDSLSGRQFHAALNSFYDTWNGADISDPDGNHEQAVLDAIRAYLNIPEYPT